MKKTAILIFLLSAGFQAFPQYFIDSCFSSAAPSTTFAGNTNIWGQDADLMQWTGSSWTGSWPGANLTIAPPAGGSGCRAVFCGNSTSWTSGGEVFGLRLVTPLVAGTTYSIPVTYVSHGTGSTGSFAPYVYSNSSATYTGAVSIGTLPAVGYTWATNNITFTATAAQNGHMYIVFGTRPSGTSGMFSSYCCDLVAPCNVDLGPDQTVCSGSSVTLNATTTGATYLWSTGATTSTISVSSSGSYWVQITVGACTDRDTCVVTVNPNPTVNLGSDQTICSGQTATFNATTTGATYLWSTGATTPTISTSTAGNYSVTVTVNGCTGNDNANLTVNALPTVNLGSDQTICSGQTATFNATTTGATYLWSTGATTSTITTGTAGSYSVTVSVGGCTGTDNVSLFVNPNLSVDIGVDTAICSGQSITFDAGIAGGSYIWNTGATTSSITVSASGTYSVSVTSGGCSGNDDIVLTVNPLPVFDLGPDQSLCSGQSALLDATTTGATYLWSDGSTGATLNASATGTYTVDVTVSGCSASDDVYVDIQPPVLVDLGADTTVCPGVPVSLDAAQAGATYEWNTAATTGSISVSSPGTYWVIVSQGNCSGSDTIDVFNYPEVIVNLGADRSICPGDEITLDAGNPGATYIWSTGASTQSVVVSADGQYSVFVSMNGCSGDDDIFITMLQDPFVDLGADEVLCEGLTKVLYASFPASDYVWQDGSADDFYYVTSSGTYSVSVSNSCGTVSDTAEITFIDCDCSVFIPSAFSPTRDEINDKFLPVSTCGWRKFDLMIYNRWGKMLFRSQDGEAGWDGLYDGELVPQGIYTYVLHYTKDTPDNIAEVTYGYVMVLTQP